MHVPVKEGTPLEVLWLSRLLPPWPSVPYGGCRDFHTAAIYFAHGQADKLVALRASLSQSRSDSLLVYTREHNITPDEILLLTFDREPHIPSEYFGTKSSDPLPPRSDLAGRGYRVTGHTTADLTGQKQKTGLGLMPGMLEWFRTRPVSIALQYFKQLSTLGSKLADPEYKDVWAGKPLLYLKLKNQNQK